MKFLLLVLVAYVMNIQIPIHQLKADDNNYKLIELVAILSIEDVIVPVQGSPVYYYEGKVLHYIYVTRAKNYVPHGNGPWSGQKIINQNPGHIGTGFLFVFFVKVFKVTATCNYLPSLIFHLQSSKKISCNCPPFSYILTKSPQTVGCSHA